MNDLFGEAILAGTIFMWHKLFPTSEVGPGTIKCAKLGDKKILVTQSDGKYYACGAVCPHQGISMEDGLVFDDEITCPEHSWVFSLRTGELTWPGSGPRIPVYPIRIDGADIEVDVND
jgi:nitrite reductase/ring-hydroxylating ferredoxin subunit